VDEFAVAAVEESTVEESTVEESTVEESTVVESAKAMLNDIEGAIDFMKKYFFAYFMF